MIRAFALAFAQLADPAFRRPLLLGLVGSAAIFAGLWAGLAFLLAHTHLFAFGWLNAVIDALGGLAALALTVILYPAVVASVTSLFLDQAVAAVEARHYPGLPPPRRLGLGEQIWGALRLLVAAVVLNLLVLPIYLVPIINLVVFYILNGYILGREYFELVASRRLEPAAVRSLWREFRVWWLFTGAVIAVLSTLPVVNLVAPLVGAAAMTHQVAGSGRAKLRGQVG